LTIDDHILSESTAIMETISGLRVVSSKPRDNVQKRPLCYLRIGGDRVDDGDSPLGHSTALVTTIIATVYIKGDGTEDALNTTRNLLKEQMSHAIDTMTVADFDGVRYAAERIRLRYEGASGFLDDKGTHGTFYLTISAKYVRTPKNI
jgi:hypothetical protein